MIEREMIEPAVPRHPSTIENPPPDPSRFCPTCSKDLVEQKCKLKCPQCGYYLSCSDFY